jgi:hypothetical protein
MKEGGFGNLGPTLYKVANSPSYLSIFHDVTSGSNGYSAGSGWDPVTGWGTPVTSLLAPALAGATGTYGAPTVTLSPANGDAGTNILVSGLSFNSSDATCTISSSLSGLISNPTCTITSGTVSGSFTVGSVGSGSYTVTVTGAPTGDAGSTSFTVTPLTMSVSYSVIGGGSPSAPVFHYILNGATKSVTLSKTSTSVSVDAGTTGLLSLIRWVVPVHLNVGTPIRH